MLARRFAPLPLLLMMGFAALAATACLAPVDLTALGRAWRAHFAEGKSVDPKAVAYVDSGNASLAQGEYDEAIAEYTSALAIDPDYAEAYEGRGNVYFAQGYLDAAIADYDYVILLLPEYADAYFRRAVAYYNKGDYERAIVGYNEVIRLNPTFVLAYTNRNLAYLNRNTSAAPSPITFGQSASSQTTQVPGATAPSRNIAGATASEPRNEPWPTTMRQSGWGRNTSWPSTTEAASVPRTREATTTAPSRATVNQSGWIRRPH